MGAGLAVLVRLPPRAADTLTGKLTSGLDQRRRTRQANLMPARRAQATASREERAQTAWEPPPPTSEYRNEKAHEQRSDDGRIEEDPACKSGTRNYTVNQTVPMTDALIGRACSTHADLRRRALLVFALLFVVDARARTARHLGAQRSAQPSAASPSHPPMRPGIPERVSPFDLRVHQREPQRTLGRRLHEHTPGPEVLHMQEDRVCAPHEARGATRGTSRSRRP